MKKVTTAQLETILSETVIITGMANFSSLIQLTEPKCTKKDRVTKLPNPYNTIQKMSSLSIVLNTEYETRVTNQLKREDKEKDEYKKGQNTMPIEKCEANNFFGYFRGKAVIEYNPYKNSHPKSLYIADGKLTDKAKLANYLPTPRPASNQGTTTEIFWRKLYVSNIRRITLNGTTYKVVN